MIRIFHDYLSVSAISAMSYFGDVRYSNHAFMRNVTLLIICSGAPLLVIILSIESNL